MEEMREGIDEGGGGEEEGRRGGREEEREEMNREEWPKEWGIGGVG